MLFYILPISLISTYLSPLSLLLTCSQRHFQFDQYALNPCFRKSLHTRVQYIYLRNMALVSASTSLWDDCFKINDYLDQDQLPGSITISKSQCFLFEIRHWFLICKNIIIVIHIFLFLFIYLNSYWIRKVIDSLNRKTWNTTVAISIKLS